MKKFILSIVLFSFFACNSEPSLVTSGRKSYQEYFNKILKDPNSLQIYDEKYVVDEENKKVTWTIDYGAKNSFGGMVRKTITFETGFAGTNLKVDGEYVGW
jgi:hypothetical protein